MDAQYEEGRVTVLTDEGLLGVIHRPAAAWELICKGWKKESMAGESLRGKVFEKIRNDILRGRYKKGDELVECTIGKELGVSRTPVREAIRQLELEGLVQLIPNKGAFVTGISARDVMDMYLSGQNWKGFAQLWQPPT